MSLHNFSETVTNVGGQISIGAPMYKYVKITVEQYNTLYQHTNFDEFFDFFLLLIN